MNTECLTFMQPAGISNKLLLNYCQFETYLNALVEVHILPCSFAIQFTWYGRSLLVVLKLLRPGWYLIWKFWPVFIVLGLAFEHTPKSIK